MLTILTCLVYAAWIVALASLCSKVMSRKRAGQPSPGARIAPADALAFIPALVSFFCIPPGSLPPLWNTAWSGAACLVCLILCFFFSGGKQGLAPSLVLCLTGLAFARYAWMRGMPGSFANLGTYVAVPYWQTASRWELAAFLLLAASFLQAMRATLPEPGNARSLVPVLQAFARGGVFVSLFFPLTLAPFVPWPGMVAATGDFLLFWGKTLALAAVLFLIPAPSTALSRLSLAGSCAGALIIFVTSG